MNKKHSRILQTGEFDVFDNGKDFSSAYKTKRAPIELKEPSFEGEKMAPQKRCDVFDISKKFTMKGFEEDSENVHFPPTRGP